MCRKYKLAFAISAESCWIGALLHCWSSSGSLMTNCWSFTIAATKNAPNDHFHTFIGIAWLLHLSARQCTNTHCLWDSWVFLDRETPDFMPPCCVVLTRWTFFISKPDWVHHRSRVATDSTSWDKEACTHDTLAAFRMAYLTLTQ